MCWQPFNWRASYAGNELLMNWIPSAIDWMKSSSLMMTDMAICRSGGKT